MKTKRKAVRRVTSAFPLECVEVTVFDQDKGSHDLHLQTQPVISDLGLSDSLLDSANQNLCKPKVGGGEISTATDYGEETVTIGAMEDDTFSVDHECCYATAVSVDHPSQSSLRVRDPCVAVPVQTTGACHVNYALAHMLCCLSIEICLFFKRVRLIVF